MTVLIYKELSYRIIGIAFEIYNSLGDGLKEKDYARAFEEILKQEKIKYQREVYYPLKIRDKTISKKYFDFLVEGKIVLELKSGNRNYRQACIQLFEYLKVSDIDLGIIIRFTNDGVKYKRIIKSPQVLS